MKNFLALKILDIFKGLYKKLGINYDIMRLIIQSKLVMDSRRVQNTAITEEEGEKSKNYFYSSLIAYAVVGLFSAPIMIMDINPIIKMTFYFGFFMIMILTVFISDFSTVILDIKDKEILGTKGIDSKTLNAAKITHIFIYISLLSLSISAFSLVVSLRYGVVFFLLFLLSIFLVDIFMIIVTATMYFIILKLFKGEKLKDMINIFQILFLLIFTIGYQIIGQSFNFVDLKIVYSPEIWNLLLPPIWFASNFSILQGGELNGIIISLSLMSIIVPIASILLYIKLIPMFEVNLQKLNDNTYKNKKSKESITLKISRILCKDKEERAFFNFVHDVISKEREFKMKVYPSLAMGAFMPFLMIVASYDRNGINAFLSELEGSMYFLSGYFTVVIVQNLVNMIQYSNEYEASWIYKILPIKSDKSIYSGMFKAIIYKLVLPLFIVISIVFLILFKVEIIKHLIVIFLSTIIVSMMTFKFNDKNLPFSVPYKVASSASSILVLFKSIIFVGTLLGIHSFITLRGRDILIWLYSIVLIVVIYTFWNKVFIVTKNS